MLEKAPVVQAVEAEIAFLTAKQSRLGWTPWTLILILLGLIGQIFRTNSENALSATEVVMIFGLLRLVQSAVIMVLVFFNRKRWNRDRPFIFTNSRHVGLASIVELFSVTVTGIYLLKLTNYSTDHLTAIGALFGYGLIQLLLLYSSRNPAPIKRRPFRRDSFGVLVWMVVISSLIYVCMNIGLVYEIARASYHESVVAGLIASTGIVILILCLCLEPDPRLEDLVRLKTNILTDKVEPRVASRLYECWVSGYRYEDLYFFATKEFYDTCNRALEQINTAITMIEGYWEASQANSYNLFQRQTIFYVLVASAPYLEKTIEIFDQIKPSAKELEPINNPKYFSPTSAEIASIEGLRLEMQAKLFELVNAAGQLNSLVKELEDYHKSDLHEFREQRDLSLFPGCDANMREALDRDVESFLLASQRFRSYEFPQDIAKKPALSGLWLKKFVRRFRRKASLKIGTLSRRVRRRSSKDKPAPPSLDK